MMSAFSLTRKLFPVGRMCLQKQLICDSRHLWKPRSACFYSTTASEVLNPNLDVHSSEAKQLDSQQPVLNSSIKYNKLLESEVDDKDIEGIPESVIEPHEQVDLSTYSRALGPTFNAAAYANRSELIQKLTDLGVQWPIIEEKKMLRILNYTFNHMAPYITFLHDVGVPADKLGHFITENPYIFDENIENLTLRIKYLVQKKFTNEMIANILVECPMWLNFTVKDIDANLGSLQKRFLLDGNQVRYLASANPKVFASHRLNVEVTYFTLKEEFELEEKEVKRMILRFPEILSTSTKNMMAVFDIVCNRMDVPIDYLIYQAQILLCPPAEIKNRHLFLKALGRNQYNPRLPGYVSLKDISKLSDQEFCEKVANSSVLTYHEYLKSLN